jgi:hypothetical protein
MVLFAAGHTFGFLAFRPPTAEGLAVWNGMNEVHFSVGSSTFSYGRFYRGFGLSISVSMVFLAWLAWTLAAMTPRAPEDARRIAWALFVVQALGAVLSLLYFAAPPAVLSVLTAVCFAMGAIRLRGTVAG